MQIADENTVQYTYSTTVTRYNGSCEVLLEWTLDCGNAHASSYQNNLQTVFSLELFAPLLMLFLSHFSSSVNSCLLPLFPPVTNSKARLEGLSFAFYWAVNL